MTSATVDIPAHPSDRRMDRLIGVLEPLSRVTQPKLYGLDNLPGAPCSSATTRSSGFSTSRS